MERIDVVNLRLMGEEGAGGAAEVPFEDQLATMADLRAEGKIGGIGLSNVTLEQVRAGLAQTEIACVQNPMSLLARDDEPVLELCRDAGIPFVPFFPLGSAFPGMPKVTEQPVVRRSRSIWGPRPPRWASRGCWRAARTSC